MTVVFAAEKMVIAQTQLLASAPLIISVSEPASFSIPFRRYEGKTKPKMKAGVNVLPENASRVMRNGYLRISSSDPLNVLESLSRFCCVAL